MVSRVRHLQRKVLAMIESAVKKNTRGNLMFLKNVLHGPQALRAYLTGCFSHLLSHGLSPSLINTITGSHPCVKENLCQVYLTLLLIKYLTTKSEEDFI